MKYETPKLFVDISVKPFVSRLCLEKLTLSEKNNLFVIISKWCVFPSNVHIPLPEHIYPTKWKSCTENIYHQIGSPYKWNTFHFLHAISRNKKKLFN